jgi:transposase
MIRLTDAQWGRIAELLPPRRAGRGRPRADDRQTLEAILYIQRTGCAWADLPPELGNHATAHRRWQEWRADGLWDQIVALADRPLPSTAKEQHAGKDAVAPIEQSGGVRRHHIARMRGHHGTCR